MTPKVGKIHALFAILTALLTACGPTRPQVDVIGPATRNLATARAAGAATYAPLELRAAEQRLTQANSATAHEDYDEAAVLASESAVNSELAAAKSRLGKAREAADSLRQQNEELSREAARHTDGGGLQ
jgi:uncharacterized protein DUF4398